MNRRGLKLHERFDKIERATIVPSMSSTVKIKKRKRGPSKSRTKGQSIRFVKGKVVVRVGGYGVQKLAPSHLIKHINKQNIRKAANSVLKQSNKKRTKKRKSKKKLRRKK